MDRQYGGNDDRNSWKIWVGVGGWNYWAFPMIHKEMAIIGSSGE